MKIRLRSQYDHFTVGQTPKYIEWSQDGEVNCYANEFVKTVDTPKEKSIALLIEPRSLYGGVYDWMEVNYAKFKYVFTHDSILLSKLPNAKLILFGGVWASDPQEKTKNISMISSDKHLCPLHDIRYNLCRQLERYIDCYGYNGHRIDTISAHAPYRYAVVIENYIDDYWFTEKICNCFANKTIPIYVGARNIEKYFNADGIIQVVPEDIKDVVKSLKPEEEYNKHLEAIEDNFQRVKKYYCFEDWFYLTYKDLLEGI